MTVNESELHVDENEFDEAFAEHLPESSNRGSRRNSVQKVRQVFTTNRASPAKENNPM